MKKLLMVFVSTFSLAAMAHNIEGTLVLKGALKTNVMVKDVKTSCKVRIEKVKNLRDEDDFGNPAYDVKMNITLDGSDSKTKTKIKYSETQQFINLFVLNGKREVRDLEYISKDGSSLEINKEGRVRSVSLNYEGKKITCSF